MNSGNRNRRGPAEVERHRGVNRPRGRGGQGRLQCAGHCRRRQRPCRFPHGQGSVIGHQEGNEAAKKALIRVPLKGSTVAREDVVRRRRTGAARADEARASSPAGQCDDGRDKVVVGVEPESPSCVAVNDPTGIRLVAIAGTFVSVEHAARQRLLVGIEHQHDLGAQSADRILLDDNARPGRCCSSTAVPVGNMPSACTNCSTSGTAPLPWRQTADGVVVILAQPAAGWW